VLHIYIYDISRLRVNGAVVSLIKYVHEIHVWLKNVNKSFPLYFLIFLFRFGYKLIDDMPIKVFRYLLLS